MVKFFDSYNNEVKEGSKIIIERHYSYDHFNNRPAIVLWDRFKGMYKFRFTDHHDNGSLHDFYGIHEFKVVK
jgi:hypothetical protein